MKNLKALAKANDKLMTKLARRYSQKLVNLVPVIIGFVRNNRLSNGLLAPISLNRLALSDLLIKAGLPLWSNFAEEIEEMGSFAIGQLVDQGFDPDIIGGVGQLALLTAMDTTIEDLSLQMDRIASNMLFVLKNQLEQAQVLPVSMSQIAGVLSERFGVYQHQAMTLVNTALAGIQREVNKQVGVKLKSLDVETLYVYQGPQDDATRPFCSPLVGKAYTEKQIAKLSNGQGMDVFKYGGGFNCRHGWFAMSKGILKEADIEQGSNDDIESANRLEL